MGAIITKMLMANGEWVDVDPLTQSVPSGATKITLLENLQKENEELRIIKVIKKNAIKTIANDFASAMSED